MKQPFPLYDVLIATSLLIVKEQYILGIALSVLFSTTIYTIRLKFWNDYCFV